jgi:acyl carrier protein
MTMSKTGSYDADTLIDWLVEHIARQLKLVPDSIPLNEAFFDIGLNSLDTLIISSELGEFLGIGEFNPSLFWDYPTIDKLAEHLAKLPPKASQEHDNLSRSNALHRD